MSAVRYQYFYAEPECPAPDHYSHPDCRCWHDEGTGPCSHLKHSAWLHRRSFNRLDFCWRQAPHPLVRYQVREIGESDWRDCDKGTYARAQNDPTLDTRELPALYGLGDCFTPEERGRDLYTAGIAVGAHGNAIECYGETMTDAVLLRDVVLRSVNNSLHTDRAAPPVVTAWVGAMKTSAGTDHYVCVGYRGGAYLTPQKYRNKARADYDVAEWLHLFGQGPKPNLLDYDTADENDALVPYHPDDLAVDRFAAALKAKLREKRAQGRRGWNDPDACPIDRLQQGLVDHVGKGDPVDVGAYAMMLFNRGGSTQWHRPEHSRWALQQDGDDVLICFGNHENSEPCQYQRYTRADNVKPSTPPYPDIAAMVNQFLGWRLPDDFSPDAGVTLDREYCRQYRTWPIGTNLLTATQARQMIEHMLARGTDTAPQPSVPDDELSLGDKDCTKCGGRGYTDHGRHEFPGVHASPHHARLCSCTEERRAQAMNPDTPAPVVARDLAQETRDACDQLQRYGGGVADEALMAVLNAVVELNDDLQHGRDGSLIRAQLAVARTALARIEARYPQQESDGA